MHAEKEDDVVVERRVHERIQKEKIERENWDLFQTRINLSGLVYTYATARVSKLRAWARFFQV